ncbi:cation:proton antiporter (plasmid) [Pontibacillus sp. ALD_SL1]|uniref:monovalent cation:proton antiporter family protein n=1 Tax=Pontibacillus sp. ALD_SL1 TaxID=2777185 RepID=UPI001A96E984|nr:cation:proton antiporter [Pontibacillus sp. ALD_SL1]QST02063.1 cation:proton antiporter [Pontibacillus sp. ALD_SL1]
MHHDSLLSLMVVVGIAFIIPIVLHRFRLHFIPVVIAEIIAGILLGKSGLDVIESDSWLELLSMLGFIYLMFLSGLEIDFKRSPDRKRKGGYNPFLAASLVYGGLLALSCGSSYLLYVYGVVEDPLFMTILISTISLGVVLPVLKEKGLLQTKTGQTILLVSVIADFVSMILLALYVAIRSEERELSILILLLFVMVFVTYYFAKPLLSFAFFDVLKRGSVQLGVRGVFALVLFFVVLSESLGVESILGAFLAGVIVSLLSPDESFKHQLDSFGYGFLIPIFFVMVGVNIDIALLMKDKSMLLLMPLLLGVMYMVKILPVFLLRKHFTLPQMLGMGALLTSTLSLVIAATEIALQMGMITNEFASAMILVSVVICLVSPMLFNAVSFHKEQEVERVTIIGVNRITLPVARDLMQEGYNVRILSERQEKLETKEEHQFPIVELDSLDNETITRAFEAQDKMVICGTKNDSLNETIAKWAFDSGIERILTRIEDPKRSEDMKKNGFHTFSTLTSTQILVKTFVSYPGLMELMDGEQTVREVAIRKAEFNFVPLRSVPFLGDVLIIKVIRGDQSIIPHGDTMLQKGDRLIVSGSLNHIRTLQKELG